MPNACICYQFFKKFQTDKQTSRQTDMPDKKSIVTPTGDYNKVSYGISRDIKLASSFSGIYLMQVIAKKRT